MSAIRKSPAGTSPKPKPVSPASQLVTALKTALGWLQFKLEVSAEPSGRRLGTINVPGALRLYLNIDASVMGLILLDGYIELV